MKRFGRTRKLGVVAACVAAYALLLQTLLASTLIASLSPAQFAAGHYLCLATVDAPSTPDDSSKPTKNQTGHCTLCPAGSASGAVLPPVPALADRIAIPALTAFVFDGSFTALPHPTGNRARGPPHLS